MATADGVKSKLQGLIDSANAKTGGNDTTLTGAVNKLIAGFGQGGGSSGGASGIYMAKITPEEDLSELIVTHNLGTIDLLITMCFVESFGEDAPQSVNGSLAKIWAKTDIPVRFTSTENTENYEFHVTYNAAQQRTGTPGYPTSLAYKSGVVDENKFKFAMAGGAQAWYMTGVTYTVIIMAANAFSEV